MVSQMQNGISEYEAHKNCIEQQQQPQLQQHQQNVLTLKTFFLPESVEGTELDVELGKMIIGAWQSEGILQIAMDARERRIAAAAMAENRHFVRRPLEEKKEFVSELSYSGYIASKEELTGGKLDAAEIFTVTKDLPEEDPRVKAGWPCHGPVCWPGNGYKEAISAFMEMLGKNGEKLMKLVALGLGLPMDILTKFTADGWHHMRVLHFPERVEGSKERGIGSHTDYGMLVLASQDSVGGLFVRPPLEGEWRPRNWLKWESSAGLYEHDDEWYFVPPCAGTLTCFPGDMLQYLTGGFLLSTPHKVRLNTEERFALAYFHEPNFNGIIRPLKMGGGDGRKTEPEAIHYGTHFTNMFLRCYPERMTSKHILANGGMEKLEKLKEEAMAKSKTDCKRERA